MIIVSDACTTSITNDTSGSVTDTSGSVTDNPRVMLGIAHYFCACLVFIVQATAYFAGALTTRIKSFIRSTPAVGVFKLFSSSLAKSPNKLESLFLEILISIV